MFQENISITKSVTLKGAGESATILDGQGSGRVITIDSTSESLTVAVLGVTIQNGKVSTGLNDFGGGIYNPTVLGSVSKAKLTVTNATIRANSANHAGAGIYNGGTLTLTNVTITGNSTTGGGGGIANSGKATLDHVTISGNRAGGGGGVGNGGQIGIAGSGTMTLTNVTIRDNVVSTAGVGGIDNADGGTMTLMNVTINNNSAEGSVGAIENISGNRRAPATMTLINVTISRNKDVLGGTAIFNGNQAGRGVATMYLTNVTINDNFPFRGIWNGSTDANSVILKNVLLANNGEANCSPYKKGNISSLGHNLSSDASCADIFKGPGDLNNTDPKLDPEGLKDNGGFTQTIALLPGSPAIDAVAVKACTDQSETPQPIPTDQRGVSRPQGKACDIGAFELTQ